MHDPDCKKPGSGVPEPRQPYEPPAIEESSDFETLALTCASSAGVCAGPDPYYSQVEYQNS